MKSGVQLVRLLLILGAVLPYCICYHDGAPESACDSLNPSGHGPSQVGNEASPYTVTVSDNGQPADTYDAGKAYTVHLETSGDTKFKGFLIRARRANTSEDQNQAIGFFTVSSSDMKATCTNAQNTGNALTHTLNTEKSGLVLTWTAPTPREGHLEFMVTVVQTQPRYWTFKATPNQLRDPTRGDLTEAPIGVDNSAITLDDCNTDSGKGCYSVPSGCTTGCDAAVTWKVEGGKIRFEMSSKEDYVALGFSSDKTMGGDKVIACLRDTGTDKVEAINSENVGYDNRPSAPRAAGISDQMNGYADAEVKCRFLHDGLTDGFKDGDTKGYFLFLASGSTSGSNINKHSSIPLISDNEVKVTDGQFVGGSLSKPWLVKIHGVTMMIAWVACASIGILMARYYKDVWADSTLLSQKVWFTIHRFLMVTVFTLTIVGFVVIFIHVKGWSDIETDGPKIVKAHPFIGVLVTVLAIVNPIMAMFRPHPGEANRVIFNWAHWGVGTVAHVVSIFTVFLGLSLPSAEGVAPDYLIWIMVAFVCFHVLVDIVLEVHKCTIKSNKGSNTMEMQQMGQGGKSDSSDGTTFRKMLLIVYVLVVVGLAGALTVIVLIQ